MKKKNLFLAAIAVMAMAGCTSEDFAGDQSLREANEQAAITFGFDVPTATRASGSEAAEALGKQFIVYGEKSESSANNATGTAPTAGNLVFPNYQVNYTENTAYTTTSNTKDWEYVGFTHSTNYQTNITRKATSEAAAEKASSAAQTIKYWDYSASNYVFTAVSAKKEDIEDGRVKIQKNEYGTTVYDKGYTITLAKTGTDPSTYPDMSKIYLSDRQEISLGTGTDRTATNAYGGNVTLQFRNLLAQVRAGIYETISGYDIKEITFYVSDGSDEGDDLDATTDHAFGAICPNKTISSYEGNINVTYYSEGSSINQPKVSTDGTAANDLVLGKNYNTLSPTALLGKEASSPTWDTSGGTFTSVFPQPENTTSLKLRVDYTLWNSVTKEVIEVKGATAEIPAQYLQWKPNYKYTYLFKISDGTNGSTGGSVVGLYPITFDAVTIEAGTGETEYITTVSEPSITTFGVKDDKYTSGKDEYEAGSDIYVTIMDGSSVVTPVLGSNVNVYLASTADATNFPITEASVAESIAETAAGTKKVTTESKNSDGSTCFTAAPAPVNTVPGEDGVNKTIDALKLTGVKATTTTTALAIEYIKAATYEAATGTYVTGTKYYTDNTGATEVDTTSFEQGVTDVSSYFVLSTPAVKVYKIIKVAAAPAEP